MSSTWVPIPGNTNRYGTFENLFDLFGTQSSIAKLEDNEFGSIGLWRIWNMKIQVHNRPSINTYSLSPSHTPWLCKTLDYMFTGIRWALALNYWWHPNWQVLRIKFLISPFPSMMQTYYQWHIWQVWRKWLPKCFRGCEIDSSETE